MKKNKIIPYIMLFSLIFITSCFEENDLLNQRLSSTDPRTISQIVSQKSDLSSLAGAWTKIKLDEELSTVNSAFTLFAPNNDAFSKVNLTPLSDEVIKNIVLNHVISTKTADFSSTLTSGYLKTLGKGFNDNNLSLYVNSANNTIQINGVANFVSGAYDIGATNGIIHTVNGVLLPPSVVDHVIANPNFSSLAAAVVRANLVEDLKKAGPFTIFVPNNAAFEKFMMDVDAAFGWKTLNDIPVQTLKEVLLYHVIGTKNLLAATLSDETLNSLQSESFKINNGVIDDASYTNTNVVLTDVQGTNGIIHGVDKVLLPNTVFQRILDKTLNLVQRTNDKGYTKFLEAVEKVGLTTNISTNNLTAFIPNNGAFTTFFLKLKNFKSLNDFKTPEQILLLKKLVEYHLHSGPLMSSNLTTGLNISTLNGDNVTYSGTSLVSSHANATEATFVNTNIGASNGLIHEIDNVLVPDAIAKELGYPEPATGGPVYGYKIYDDALADFWVGGWTSPDFQNTEKVKSGSFAIKVNFSGYDGFQIGDRNSENLSKYTTINATLYSEKGTRVQFILNEQWNSGQVVNIPAGKWTDVSVPIASIANGTTSLNQFVIRDDSGVANTLYIDQIGLDVTFQAAIPKFAYEVYTEDNLNAGWIGGWSSPVFNSTNKTSTGLFAIEVDLAGNAGFQLGGTNINLSNYSVVKFSIYSETPNQFKLVLNEKWDGYILNPIAGKWNHYTVPLSSVLYGTSTYTQFVIQEISGTSTKLFIDDIGFD